MFRAKVLSLSWIILAKDLPQILKHCAKISFKQNALNPLNPKLSPKTLKNLAPKKPREFLLIFTQNPSKYISVFSDFGAYLEFLCDFVV